MDCSAGPFSAAWRLCARYIFAKAQTRNFFVARVRRVLYRVAFVIVLALSAFSIFLIHSYHSYAQLVDARLARGYLTSRTGIYASPRTLRAGQKYSRAALAAALARAGYIESNDASEVWNGSFSVHDDAIEIRPTKTFPSVVKVSFDRDERIASLVGDDITLDSFALEPEPLTNDSTKNGTHGSLAFKDIPP